MGRGDAVWGWCVKVWAWVSTCGSATWWKENKGGTLDLLDPQVGPSFSGVDDGSMDHMGREGERVFFGISVRVKPDISIDSRGDAPLELYWVNSIKDLDQAVDPLFIILAVLSSS